MEQTLSDAGPRTKQAPAEGKRALTLPAPPTFSTIEAERQHRKKERLAGALRIFGKLGFSEGVAGHITARYLNCSTTSGSIPSGMNFRHIRVSDLILVNHEGQVVEGRRPVNLGPPS